MSQKKINSIPFIVVKSFVKTTKDKNKYAHVYSAVAHNTFLSHLSNKALQKTMHDLEGVHDFQSLGTWLSQHVAIPGNFDVNTPASYPHLYRYVTDLTNTLIHYILEPQGLDMRSVGEIGQLTYDLSCRTILQDNFVEDKDTRKIEEITDIEELKSRLFREYLSAPQVEEADGHTIDFGSFMVSRLGGLDAARQVLEERRQQYSDVRLNANPNDLGW